MVGSAIVRALQCDGFSNILTISSSELDLRDFKSTEEYFQNHSPEYVFMAAAKVGGIMANLKYQGQFIYDNLMMQTNLIHISHLTGVRKFLFLGSSCIYPKQAPQPLKEEYLWTGPLEPTNDAYAVAKLAGVKMCQAYAKQYDCNFISVMPSNLYGPNDNYDLKNSHVLPALIRKFCQAKENKIDEVEVWGTGNPKREFLHVDDLVEACLYLMANYNEPEIINVGTGEDNTIKYLAEKIKALIEYQGKITYDTSKPDGTMQKLLDVSKINALGWSSKIKLEDGLGMAIQDFQTNEQILKY